MLSLSTLVRCQGLRGRSIEGFAVARMQARAQALSSCFSPEQERRDEMGINKIIQYHELILTMRDKCHPSDPINIS